MCGILEIDGAGAIPFPYLSMQFMDSHWVRLTVLLTAWVSYDCWDAGLCH